MASIMAIWLTARSCGCVCTSPATCLCGPKRSRSMVKCLWQQWALQDLLHVNIDKTWLSAINKGSFIKAFFTRSICTKPLALAGMEHNVPIYENKYSVLCKTSTWPISLRRRELGSEHEMPPKLLIPLNECILMKHRGDYGLDWSSLSSKASVLAIFSGFTFVLHCEIFMCSISWTLKGIILIPKDVP